MEDKEDINIGSDNNYNKKHIGYYTRSKRRKLENGGEEYTKAPHISTHKRKLSILCLPDEILSVIFKNVSKSDLSENVRLVNHRFKEIAEGILNTCFKKIGKTITNLTLTTEQSLQRADDDMEVKCVLKLLSMLEILKTQYDIVVATVWRYVYNDYYRTTKSCVFAGKLIDVYFTFMDKFLHCPYLLYASAVIRDYDLPREITMILRMTKSFCVHFDKVVEEPLIKKQIGCKIVDLVDCTKFVKKTIVHEHIVGRDYFAGEYYYYFQNSWFVSFPVESAKSSDWCQHIRMMHMRLRRIVQAHNEMFLQQYQYERELGYIPDTFFIKTRKPGNNSYTGYGDIGNNFFYYGVMNDGAYIQKFGEEEGLDQEPQIEVDEFFDEDIIQEDIPEHNTLYGIPYLGFRVHVKVRCPLACAPLNFLITLDEEFKQQIKRRKKTDITVDMKVLFDCESACYPRLPTTYEYHQIT
ncbi:uncharacterized protein LOC114331545 [Diabrotica virgifera virgifera]|uniref:Uncharacterized protein LOC114331545 n=1 Tax=Diabrotica virgifera virgifera TaxID=50390 RepID=A0A6P7FVH9_DIAVI|nr:uncharacterized protein LOC114331545 [Diabrotica virgifera virgifera]